MASPHIIFICLDTVRKDFYDMYAPRLKNQVTIQFEEMRAASSWSVPSHAAMVTGKLPHQTGLHAYNQNFRTLSPESTWFAQLDGYQTTCISANIYASPVFGFDTLFDHTIAVSPSRRYPDGIDIDGYIRSRDGDDGILTFVREALHHDHPVQSLANGAAFKAHDLCQHLPVENPFDYGAKSISRAIQNQLVQATGPMFVFANFMDAHGPHSPFYGLDDSLYECSPSFTSLSFKDWDVNISIEHGDFAEEIETVRQLYAAEIDYLDRVISKLIKTIRETISRETIFVITADHGENLAYSTDEYLMNHVSSLSEALLHVPFDVCSESHSGVVTSLESHLSIGEIINRLQTGEPIKECISEIVAAEIAGSGSGLPDENQQYWDRTQRAVFEDGHKYVLDSLGDFRVFDITGDASTQTELEGGSSSDVGSKYLALFESAFEDSIDEFSQRAKSESTHVEVDASTESRLKELGYL